MSSNQANPVNLKPVNEKIRAFIGFRMSAEVAQAIAAFVDHLKHHVAGDGIIWVDPHNIHLTLRFLGDAVDLHMITPLIEVLKAIAGETRPFAIRVQGLGVFPSSQRPRTVWVGIVSEELKKLAVRVDRAAVQCGFHSEPRPFAPHITIARLRKIKHWKALREVLGERVSLAFGSLTVDRISIYRSIKEGEARIYEDIASFPLAST
jgi:RNA 2',3'-cyclic 3'-phosphodiesterase